MATKLLTERYATDLHGVLNCYDRIILAGHVHPWCYDKGMTGYLYQHVSPLVTPLAKRRIYRDQQR